MIWFWMHVKKAKEMFIYENILTTSGNKIYFKTIH
jgi:hypothetical protein